MLLGGDYYVFLCENLKLKLKTAALIATILYITKYICFCRVLPVYILLRFECVEYSISEGSGGEVEVDTVHPGVLIQLQHLLYNLHANTKTKRHTHR